MEKTKLNLTNQLHQHFEAAATVSYYFADDNIRTAYLVMGMVSDDTFSLSKYLFESGIQIDIPIFILDLMEKKKEFARIFGEEAAESYFIQEKNLEDGQEEEETQEEEIPIIKIGYSDMLQNILNEASRRCEFGKQNYLDSNNVLSVILEHPESSGYRFLTLVFEILPKEDISIENFSQWLKNQYIIYCDIKEKQLTLPSVLKHCCSIMNDRFVKGQASDILGREKEKYKLWNVFSKRTKRNAILLGEPGVGKTAIIEAITSDIVNEICPKEFLNYTIINLDISSMVAGTKYRGEFEEKITHLKNFIQNVPNIIVFVDEMHMMMGAGSGTEGTVDLSNSLKPILSRNECIFVGATTLKEYENIIKKDGAFERRFEVIEVEEPKNSDLKKMLGARILNLEHYHHVKLDEKVLDYIITCAHCFYSKRKNPDKTIDLCDRSMVVSKMLGESAVKREHVEKVFEECYEMFHKMTEKEKMSVAYHEIGHYFLSKKPVLKEAFYTIAVSIIPSDDFLGVNITESYSKPITGSLKFLKTQVAYYLAGRIAQSMLEEKEDSGAESDLQVATQIIENVMLKCGLDDKEFKNIFISQKAELSDSDKKLIRKKSIKMVEKIYKKTKKYLKKHKNQVDKGARYLYEHYIVTDQELEKVLEIK